jgi:hypothetical protein
VPARLQAQANPNQGGRRNAVWLPPRDHCRKANQGNRSHKDVEATIIYHFNTYTHITAAKAKPFHNGNQADILLRASPPSTTWRPMNWHLNVTSTKRSFGHQPTAEEHDPRNDDLTSAARAEAHKHGKYDTIILAMGMHFPPFAPETTGGQGASTAAVYYLFTKHMRLGSPVRRATSQAQEGHLARATPGQSDHPSPGGLRPPSARWGAEDEEELLALNRRADAPS